MVLAITAVIILCETTPFTLAVLLAFNKYLIPLYICSGSMTVNEVSIVPEAYSSVSDSIALIVVVPTPTIVNTFSLTLATNVLELV